MLRDASKRNLLIFVALVAAVLCGSQLIGYVRLSRRESQAQAERTGAAGTPARGRCCKISHCAPDSDGARAAGDAEAGDPGMAHVTGQPDISRAAEAKHQDRAVATSVNVTRTRVFLDIAPFGDSPGGRLELELYSDIVPATAQNFKQLCNGESGLTSSGKALHYKGAWGRGRCAWQACLLSKFCGAVVQAVRVAVAEICTALSDQNPLALSTWNLGMRGLHRLNLPQDYPGLYGAGMQHAW